MSDYSSELRGHAAQCMATAQTAMDEGSRLAWLEMAQKWLRFAEKAEGRVTQQQQEHHQQQQQQQAQPTKDET